MIECAEFVFNGTWKSYKIFYHFGGIEFNSPRSHQEFDFGQERVLTILLYEDFKKILVKQTTSWSIELKKKKHFLTIEKGKLCYEVLNVNHLDMVLDNKKKDEKIFLAKQARWQQIMKLLAS